MSPQPDYFMVRLLVGAALLGCAPLVVVGILLALYVDPGAINMAGGIGAAGVFFLGLAAAFWFAERPR